MKNFEIIKNLVGEYITEDKLKNIDCYARPQLAIMIPTSESDISGTEFRHSAYIIKLYFEQQAAKYMHYPAEITSPDTTYTADGENHLYCIRTAFQAQSL